MADDPEYLTINQAADRLGVDRRRIRALIAAGSLKTVANPLDRRAKLLRREDVDQLALYPRAPKKAVA
jgi:excisionase family DNA binding protein